MADAGSHAGRNALITGAASGIGATTARMIAEQGGLVVGVDRNAATLQSVIAALPVSGGRKHLAIVMDLRPVAAARSVVERAVQHAGYIDLLVNAAGVSHFTKMTELTQEEWDETMEVDLRSLFYLSTAVAEGMTRERGGRIINLGSNAGRKGRILAAHYAAAKAGVKNLSESLALAYGQKNITVNTVCPGPTTTPMWDGLYGELFRITGKTSQELADGWIRQTPLGRLGTPEDVANLILFLASDKAGFITGQEINVCGGFMLNS